MVFGMVFFSVVGCVGVLAFDLSLWSFCYTLCYTLTQKCKYRYICIYYISGGII